MAKITLKSATLLAACLCGFVFQADLTALAAALPDIGSEFGATSARAAWVIDIYSLALIFCLPIAGSLADKYGRVKIFTFGVSLFGLASVLCACADTLNFLLAARALQGVAGACMTTASFALLAGAYPGVKGARAFGFYGAVVGASMVVGPPLGSLLASTVGWRWIFWFNLPICAGAVFLARFKIANVFEQPSTSSTVDWAGAGLLAIASAALAFVLLEAPALGGFASSTVLTGFAACLIAFVGFIWIEKRHPNPAFDLKLFTSKKFIAICFSAIAGSIGFWSLLIYVPQLARGPLGLNAIETGWLLVALTLPMLVLPRYGAVLTTRMSTRSFFCSGLALIGLADLALGAIVSVNLASNLRLVLTASGLFLSGVGCAVINAQISAAAVSAVPGDRVATASAICITMRQIGFSFGIALIGAALQFGSNTNYLAAFLVAGFATLVLTVLIFLLLGPQLNDH